MSNPRITAEEPIDYLQMMCWNALCGIVEVGGSREKFNALPIRRPRFPHAGGLMAATWSHEPHKVLKFRPATGWPISTPTPARASGDRADAETVLCRAHRTLRRTTRDAVRQRQIRPGPAIGASSHRGMDTAGKGGIVKHVVGAGNPMGLRYTGFGVPTEEERSHHHLWRIRKRRRRADTSACSTDRTTRRS